MTYGTRPAVLGDDAATHDYLDNLVEADALRLRDEAIGLVREVAQLRAQLSGEVSGTAPRRLDPVGEFFASGVTTEQLHALLDHARSLSASCYPDSAGLRMVIAALDWAINEPPTIMAAGATVPGRIEL